MWNYIRTWELALFREAVYNIRTRICSWKRLAYLLSLQSISAQLNLDPDNPCVNCNNDISIYFGSCLIWQLYSSTALSISKHLCFRINISLEHLFTLELKLPQSNKASNCICATFQTKQHKNTQNTWKCLDIKVYRPYFW